MRLTVGPLPPAVYWRRRAIVLAVALLVLFLIFQACNPSDAPGEEASDQRSPGPAATGSPQPAGAVTPTTAGPEGDPTPDTSTADGSAEDTVPAADEAPAAEGEPCTDDEILVIAGASATELSQREKVTFTIWMRNESSRTCSRDLGGDERELYLRAGPGTEAVWSSRHCDGPEGSDVRELVPGYEMERYIVWNGRSSGECDGRTPTGPVLEPGEYQLGGRLGTDHSEPITIVIR